MEKRKNIIKKILITLGILCSIMLTFTVIYERPTLADSGHSVSHSSSHSSHSSSSSRRSSSSSSRSSSSRGSSSSGSSDPLAGMISIAIMIAIIVIWTIIANKNKNQSHKIVINKNNEDEIENKIKKWLKRKYFYIHREWPYKNVKPRIIIEEYLSDLKEGSLLDYKIFMFNEKLAYFLICSDRNTNLKFTFFDKNGKFINMTQDGEPNDKKLSLPDNYKEMVAMAKRISKGTIESRIDFYDINGKIYFGEITFFDSAGFGKFEPNEWDKKIGDMLKLPMKEEK